MRKLIKNPIIYSLLAVIFIITELTAIPSAYADTCRTQDAVGHWVPCATPANIALGVFVPYVTNLTPDYSAIENYIAEAGRTPAIIQRFSSWLDASAAPNPFPQDFVNYVVGKGATPMITWQPPQALTHDRTTSVLTTISSGSLDSYIAQWADAAAAISQPIYLRLMHEMNVPISRYAWSYSVNGNTAAQYVDAYRHVVNIFRKRQANNVQFVWSPVATGTNSPTLLQFYPGDFYVAWAALDGYNRFQGTSVQMFTNIFLNGYSQIVAFSKRPVMIAETASVETTGDPTVKAKWITSNFLTQVPRKFPRVKAILYFDGPGVGGNPTYPVDSSPQALSAYQSVVGNLLYSGAAPSFSFTF